MVISTQDKQEISDLPVKTLVVSGENQRFDGMAMSDVAIAVNGEITNECGAF